MNVSIPNATNANSTKRISMKNLLPSDTESHILSVPYPRQCAPFSFRGSSPRSGARLWLWLRTECETKFNLSRQLSACFSE